MIDIWDSKNGTDTLVSSEQGGYITKDGPITWFFDGEFALETNSGNIHVWDLYGPYITTLETDMTAKNLSWSANSQMVSRRIYCYTRSSLSRHGTLLAENAYLL